MIKNIIHFDAAPKTIYECLTDETKHSEFTGAAAKIENKVGGKFSTWDGYSSGENLELIPGKKIIQSWRASDWPDDVTSTATFELEPESSGTKLTFTHENVPAAFVEEIEKGWKEYYWEPLAEYLSK